MYMAGPRRYKAAHLVYTVGRPVCKVGEYTVGLLACKAARLECRAAPLARTAVHPEHTAVFPGYMVASQAEKVRNRGSDLHCPADQDCWAPGQVCSAGREGEAAGFVPAYLVARERLGR